MLLDEEMNTSRELKQAKLEAIDRLLWGTKSKARASTVKPEGQSPAPSCDCPSIKTMILLQKP